jgi:hypothetical protein
MINKILDDEAILLSLLSFNFLYAANIYTSVNISFLSNNQKGSIYHALTFTHWI